MTSDRTWREKMDGWWNRKREESGAAAAKPKA
jgi:hypothetical protein